jgi:hypothetical protein
MFNILSHQGNANQNYIKILSKPSQMVIKYQEKKKQHMLMRMKEKKEPSYTVGGNVN